MKSKIIVYLKREKVLFISAILAVISAFFVAPNLGYVKYIDIRVLVLLYCLMVIVKGFQDSGFFDYIVKRLCGGLKDARALYRMLVFICFFSGMLITNDVALITFVPFAIYSLHYCNLEKNMIVVIVLQTIAANLGSMATPIGNPQNLFLFSVSSLNTLGFEMLILPYVAISFCLLCLSIYIIPNSKIDIKGGMIEEVMELDKKCFFVYTILFIMMILTVLRIIPYLPMFGLIILVFLVIRRKWILFQADFGLLLTFVCLFIFVGNIGRIGVISSIISDAITGREIVFSAVISQVLSNVPAAMLLSGFTDNIEALIVGTNIGGLGTLIASMASIISYKLYSGTKNSNIGKYLLVFSLYNFVGLLILLGLSYIIGI